MFYERREDSSTANRCARLGFWRGGTTHTMAESKSNNVEGGAEVARAFFNFLNEFSSEDDGMQMCGGMDDGAEGPQLTAR